MILENQFAIKFTYYLYAIEICTVFLTISHLTFEFYSPKLKELNVQITQLCLHFGFGKLTSCEL